MADVPVDACRGKALTVLVLVFLGGAASGVIGSHFVDRVAVAEPDPKTTVALRDPKLVALEYLRDELVLDSSQVQQVREILDQCIMHEADLLMRIRVNQNSGRERILKLLNPEQRSKFQSDLLLGAPPDSETSF